MNYEIVEEIRVVPTWTSNFIFIDKSGVLFLEECFQYSSMTSNQFLKFCSHTYTYPRHRETVFIRGNDFLSLV